jgi:sulfite exporter TauE/SafE/copper chaperone CopZ
MSHKTKLYVQGMTCTSCETIIKNELKDMSGLHQADISCKTGILEIEHNDKFSKSEAIEKINKLGYSASTDANACVVHRVKPSGQDWLMAVLIVGVLYLAYRLLSNLGALDFINFNPDNISFGIALLIGIVASLSTCLMVVGAVVISFSAKYRAKGSGIYQTSVRPNIFFHLGRWVIFFVLGGVLGLIGHSAQISTSLTAWISIILAVILIWLGLNIIGLAPSMTKFGLHLPKGVMKIWEKLENSEHPLAPLVLGGLSFFLPCGFTQSMQIFALASGSFLTGAYTLLFFAVGTTPVLFGLGVATARFSQMKNTAFKLSVGLIVIIFSLYTASNGLAILGISAKPIITNGVVATINEENEQVIEMAVTPQGYQPSTIEIIQGIPVKWIIDGSKITGCTSQIIVPDLKISKNLERGENIIRFTPEKVGTLNFSCGMGMVKGRFIVKPSTQSPAVETVSPNAETCPVNAQGVSECAPTSSVPANQTVAGVKIDEPKNTPTASPTTPAPAVPVVSKPVSKPASEQTVTMSVDGRGYTPDVLYIKANVPVKWVITAAANLGCTGAIKIDKYNIYKELEAGQNVISFTPGGPGEIPFSCGMGMVWGKFIVTDDGTSATKPRNVVAVAPAKKTCGMSGGGGGCGCGGGR